MPRLRTALLVGFVLAGGGSALHFLGRSSNSPIAPAQPAQRGDTAPERERKKYEFEIEGCRVESDTVSPEVFWAAYEEAKKITGGKYWEPKKLSVEFGNVAFEHFKDSPFIQKPDTNAEAGFTSEALDEIVVPKEGLAHELIHFLLGPEAKKWPAVLQEMIASAADKGNKEIKVPYENLDGEWIQMAHPKALYTGSSISGLRYYALRHLGERHREKMPEVIREAFAKGAVTFHDLAALLAPLGIQHHILTPGQIGRGYVAFFRYEDATRKGYGYIRYERIAEDAERESTEDITVTFVANEGTSSAPFRSDGFIFIPAPERDIPFQTVEIRHGDGLVHRQSLR